MNYGSWSNAYTPNLTLADLAAARARLEALAPPVIQELLETAAASIGRLLLVPICAGALPFGRMRLVVLERMPAPWFEMAAAILRARGVPVEAIELVPARVYAGWRI